MYSTANLKHHCCALIKILLVTLFFYAPCVQAYNLEELAVTAGEPSSLIEGRVSVITGDMYYRESDAIAQGLIPVIASSEYFSRRRKSLPDRQDGGKISVAWKNIAQNLIAFVDNTAPSIEVAVRDNISLKYVPKKKYARHHEVSTQYKDGLKFYVDEEAYKYSLTNCSSGEISARMNFLNSHIIQSRDKKWLTLYLPDGAKRVFKLRHGYKENYAQQQYVLEHEILPNGFHIKYFWINGMISGVASYTPDENHRLCHFDIGYESEYKQNTKITLSDGNEVLYCREKKGPGRHRPVREFYLASIDRRYSPNVFHIGYCQNTHENGFLVTDITHMRGVSQSFTYNMNNATVQTLSHTFSTSTPQRTHAFAYNHGALGRWGGDTEVLDANDNLTKYYYNDKFRLTEIAFHKKRTLSHSIKLAWGQDEATSGLLQAKSLVTPDGPLFSNRYYYNSTNNMKEHRFYGNITGTQETSLSLDNGIPNGSEYYADKREYSDDGFNLTIREEEDNGRVILWSYKPGTDLPASKFICDNDKIRIRHF